MESDTMIANAIGKMVDKPFFLADESKGVDCLNSLRRFYEECGFKFPDEFRGWNWQNYKDKWIEDCENGRSTLWDLLHTLGRSIDKNFMVRGDLLIFRHDPPNKKITDAGIISALQSIIDKVPFMRKLINNVIAGKQILTFPGIYTGNGNFFIVFDQGARQLPLKFFQKYLVDVRRLI